MFILAKLIIIIVILVNILNTIVHINAFLQEPNNKFRRTRLKLSITSTVVFSILCITILYLAEKSTF